MSAPGFAPWFTTRPNPVSLTRVNYRLYDTPLILRFISDAEFRLKVAETEDEQCEASFALQELRAVLLERR